MSFEARWRQIAASAREAPSTSLQLADVARLARSRELDPIPFVSPRSGAALALAAAALTLWLAPIVLNDAGPLDELVGPHAAALPKPPALPPPPSLEAPSYYVAAATAVWKELEP